MTLIEEGLRAMRGCWRFLLRDPGADEDFNLTIEGFWRSFAMIVPALVLSYPLVTTGHQFAVDCAKAGIVPPPPELKLGASYFYVLVTVAVWPVLAAVLARLCGAPQNYVRYMIIYNWMTIPMMILTIVPNVLYLAGAKGLGIILTQVMLFFPLYVSWYVARAGLKTTIWIAVVFMVAEFAFAFGVGSLIT